ncbi:hypothetical protein KCH_16190 [Kitasatospora cheerisanensis KCTC 2395]|uniref:Uncharacterized protein n=1 Tax=Kitasatospora cheerisanensis KCTC 2395 TaxID=1348663 RepID=A0A066YY98_9ACTN|nr:hypothetical protein KCH_16190 [Kitasatospora cheerisanensis KCTC 2395]
MMSQPPVPVVLYRIADDFVRVGQEGEGFCANRVGTEQERAGSPRIAKGGKGFDRYTKAGGGAPPRPERRGAAGGRGRRR